MSVRQQAGDVDFACNAAGVRRWVQRLEWSGSAGYRNATEQLWYVDGSKEPAGVVRYGHLNTLETLRSC